MKVVVLQKNSRFQFVSILAALAFGAGAFYTLFIMKMQEAGWCLALLAFFATAMALITSTTATPILHMDETGIHDARLGIGTIFWQDIENVQIEATYGNRFLCIQVRHPERFIERLQGPRCEQVKFHQALGFKRFNIEVNRANVSLLTLKKYIDSRIPRQSLHS